MLKSVDRLSVLDGVVVAVGWCHGPDPELTLNGVRLPHQICVRFDRPDVVAVHGEELRGAGFRVVAAMHERPKENFGIRVLFADGAQLRRTAPDATAAQDLLKEFAGMVNSRTGSLLEIGSRARSGNSYRSLFPGATSYVGLDISAGPNVDLVADVHMLSGLMKSKVDFVFSVSVFEHLIMPWVAVCEINKVMTEGGVILVQSHPAYPLHDEPWDFFRFSTSAWSGLFNALTGFELLKTGYGIEAAIVPAETNGGPLQGMDEHTTYLISSCIARKVTEPKVDWSGDPSTIYNLNYSH